jgi:hypothetical protein
MKFDNQNRQPPSRRFERINLILWEKPSGRFTEFESENSLGSIFAAKSGFHKAFMMDTKCEDAR